jgi:hypothetical protein
LTEVWRKRKITKCTKRGKRARKRKEKEQEKEENDWT